MAAMREGLSGIRAALGQPGCSQRMADIIAEKLGNSGIEKSVFNS
jgi:hypothetical protein